MRLWIHQRPTSFYKTGNDSLVSQWDKYINTSGSYFYVCRFLWLHDATDHKDQRYRNRPIRFQLSACWPITEQQYACTRYIRCFLDGRAHSSLARRSTLSLQETNHRSLLLFACLHFQCWMNTLYTMLTSRAIKKQLCAPVRFHYACFLLYRCQYRYVTTVLPVFVRNLFYDRCSVSFECPS